MSHLGEGGWMSWHAGMMAVTTAFLRQTLGRLTTDNAQVDGSIVPVLAKVGGYVKTVRIAENQPVKVGQSLIQIDDAEYAVRVQQAEAELSAAAYVAGAGGVAGQADAQIRGAASQGQVVQAQILAARAAQAKAAADLGPYVKRK